MRHGATLVELLVVVGVLGILAGLAVPAATRARDRALIAQQAQRIAAAHAATRSAARLAGARAELTIQGHALRQRQWTAGGYLATWHRPGPAAEAVALSGPASPIVFDSRGYSLGAGNRTYRLYRGRDSATVVISRLGRLRILP